jgi:8-hydroxy-5-deazaflavin:NADPH oxidoreductase
MRIAVLGTGVVGRTLAARLDGLGHDVVIGTRDPAVTMARTEPGGFGTAPYPQWQAEHPGIRLLSFAEAAAFAELLFNATSGAGAMAALVAAGEPGLAGKVLIDVSNPLDYSRGMPPTLDPVNTDSLGEQLQRAFPSTHVVKALNTMNCQVMVDPGRVPGEHTAFVCGNDGAAKAAATGLIASFGWPPGAVLDVGDISAARGTEMLLPLWLRLMGSFGHADFNFHISRG